MELKILNINDKYDLDFVIKLYLTSFPSSERRAVLDMISLIQKNDNFKLYLICDLEKRIGFISIWVFDDFIFLEHFAIHSDSRNGGYGRKVLQYLISQEKLPIVGEIELPNSSEIAARREGFYKRQGFKIWYNVDYFQPNFIKEGRGLPMYLISYGDIESDFLQEKVVSTLYKKVYGYCP